MRYALFLLALLPALSAAGPARMESVQSEVFATSGTQAEIAKRGEICIARLVRNAGLGGEANAGVISSSTPEAGVVVANSRLEVRALMLKDIVQSVLTFESKDGRFRITHSDVQHGSSGWDSLRRAHFTPVYAKTPLAKASTEALQKQSIQIAECVQNPVSDF